jgi:hypothetical protein
MHRTQATGKKLLSLDYEVINDIGNGLKSRFTHFPFMLQEAFGAHLYLLTPPYHWHESGTRSGTGTGTGRSSRSIVTKIGLAS